MKTHYRPGGPVMNALVQPTWEGPQESTLVTDQPRPVPGPGEYLIRVGAAGVNFADVMQARGTYEGGPAAPYVAGFEAAGSIEEVGPDVANALPVGTRVIGAGAGAFAQYMTMSASGVLPVPEGWSDSQSLGMILNWATALAALRPLGELKKGETVLIHAAAGGVGQAAVRLARHYGAHVIATASPSKHALVTDLGVDRVLDPAHLDPEVIGPVDLVLESTGKDTFRTSLAVTRPYTGRIIVYGAASGHATLSTHDLVFTHRVQVKGLHIATLAASAPALFASLLTELDTLIARGVYPPGEPEVHPLGQGPAVLAALEARRTTGKLALDPWR